MRVGDRAGPRTQTQLRCRPRWGNGRGHAANQTARRDTLDVGGRVIGQCYPRHRHQEFLKFLQRLDAEFPGETTLHLILDNYGTHGHARVQRWLKRHPRFVLHFIPTSSSWLNLIERWFAELSHKAVRRGAFHSVRDLQRTITAFLEAWNANPTPCVWTASVERILEKITRARQRLEQIALDCTLPKRRTKTAHK